MLTDTTYFQQNDQVINHVPALSWIRSEPITSGGWELATGDYRASGGEKFVVIGNFFDNLTTQFSAMETRKGKSPMLAGSAYFYIDDVSVTPLDPPTPAPLVWDNGVEVKPEEIYVLKNIQFEFDQFVLLPVSFPELDKLVSILEKKPMWKAELAGHTDDVGSEEYNLELSRNRANNVLQYLISKGISPERLTAVGYGKQRPLVPSKDDAARTLNRRVEVRFLKGS
jgi:OmpA-OmpF porin, OOP family